MNLEYYKNVLLRQNALFHKSVKHTKNQHYNAIGIIRQRNESLILQDTLDHMAQFVDAIVLFDDDSIDDSVDIAMNHPAVVDIVKNRRWRRENRIWEETSNRRYLLSRARKYKPTWIFYFDADERYIGKIKEFFASTDSDDISAIKISLFDAYMTEQDKEGFNPGDALLGFRKKFGPERRDITMIWRDNKRIQFKIPDAREPQGIDKSAVKTMFTCQHYGKSISLEQWDETCRYYMEFFPKYSKKWEARLGKSVHIESDLGYPLYGWEDLQKNAISMQEAVENQKTASETK